MRPFLFAALVSAFVVPHASAFDVMNEKMSYVDSKYLTLGLGLGFAGLLRTTGVEGDAGFGLRVTAGHHFKKFLQAEIVYQFSLLPLNSPEAQPATGRLSTTALMNQEYIRLILEYPATVVQPYLSAGFGGYNIYGIDQETALSFPTQMQVPLAVGLRAYVFRNKLSLDAEFGYQFLFGENQRADTLALLGLDEVNFDAYSCMFTFSYHFL